MVERIDDGALLAMQGVAVDRRAFDLNVDAAVKRARGADGDGTDKVLGRGRLCNLTAVC